MTKSELPKYGGMPVKWRSMLLLMFASLIVAGCPVVPDPDPDPDPDPVVVLPVSTSPGLNVEITKVEIPADLRPVVHFTITDDAGELIPLRELTDARFILAYLDPDPGEGSVARYISYINRTRSGPDGDILQATTDSARLNGLTQEDDGTLTYKFADVIPGDYQADASHQVGGQFRRVFPIDGVTYPANAVLAFRPDGELNVATRELVTTETCNNCHTRLQAHGSRREVQYCILCHNAGSSDNEGVSVDFTSMIHKIHRGESLPSVEAGEPLVIAGQDYSEVAFPQPVQNCAACHGDAPMGDTHMTNPTIEGCASCHDRTWFGDPLGTPAGFTNHIAGQQVDNKLCSLCHTPTAPGPAPIMEAHRLATNSPLAPGLAFTVNETTTAETETGVKVTINFTAADGDGVPYTDLTALSTVAATLAYPVSDYQTAKRETITAANATANGDGTFDYTFTTEAPLGSTDTFAVAMDGRLNFDNAGTTVTQGTSSNGRMIFTVDGSTPVERRQIVANEKCNVCHSDLRLHGSLRVGVEYCVMCHNPNGTDINRRPAEALPPESINFKDMVHQIHRGTDLETSFTVFGFGGTAFDFTKIGFPGDLRNCEICHEPGTYEIPISMDAAPTVVSDGETIVSEKFPERAACTSCHDSLLTEVHAILATEPNTRVESCAVCHENNAEFSVKNVHAIQP